MEINRTEHVGKMRAWFGKLRRRLFKKREKADRNILNHRSKAERVVFPIVMLILIIHCLTLIVPVAWMFVSAFKMPLEFSGGDPFAFPVKWIARNFIDAFTLLNVGDTTFFGMVFNSVWYTLIRSVLGAFVPAVTGYVMSKYRFPGHGVIFTTAIVAMTLPIVGAGASYMKVIATLGLYDNILYVVVTSLGGFGGSFLVYYGFFKSVSWNYAEAAMIDGANPFTIFFRVMLPHAVPLILTYFITGAIGNWNEYNDMILYIPSYPTLASGLFEYQETAVRMANYPVYFAGLLISMIPTIVLFALCSDKIMTSLSMGGLKG